MSVTAARSLKQAIPDPRAHRTYANYKLQIRRHIIPAIGRVKLAKLNPAHVQGVYAAKLRYGLKPPSVRCIHYFCAGLWSRRSGGTSSPATRPQ